MSTNTERHYHTLELFKVLERLAAMTNCPDAADAARGLRPADSLAEAQKRLDETVHAYTLMARYGAPSFGGLCNVSGALTRAEAGGALSAQELLEVGATLRVIRLILEWYHKADNVTGALAPLFLALEPNKYLEEKIFAIILEDGQLADNASSELHGIRRKMRSASSRVREQLEKMVRSAATVKFLQEAIITQRGGRFVVPVKAECRGSVPGLLHDTSSSGATVFIEPMAIVELNNELKLLEAREQAEIERILWELSGEAGGFAGSTLRSYDWAVELNVAFAKARLGYEMRACAPELNAQGKLHFNKARHPLLDPKTVVPVTVTLGEDYDTLVITGPNTGGKTVTLKTVGLLTLMVMCGLMLPVSDGSTAAVFSRVLSDIGDEQSIEQSLSTFSSHMVNLVNILEQADGNTLVLLDELGAGTDPVEGAALAMAILEQLRASKAKIAATTHYAELKAFALDTAGVQNACCEFDVESLRPTYRLIIGQPGRSNAFAISRRLGLSETVVQRATALIGDTGLKFEQVVEALERARLEHEAALEELKTDRARLDDSLRTARMREDELDRRARQSDEQAHTAARLAAEQLERRVGEILNELETIKKSTTKDNAAEMAARARALARRGVDELEQQSGRTKKAGSGYTPPRPLRVGDTVLITSVGKQGVILSLPDSGKATGTALAVVQAGIIKTTLPIEELRLVEEPKITAAPTPAVQYKKGRAGLENGGKTPTRMLGPELDIRGQNAEEGVMELDRFIDEAVMGSYEQVTIIHGRGTGVLRAAVQTRLRRHPNVKSFRAGLYGEGEDGVTVVELK